MVALTLRDQLMNEFDKLPSNKQEQVLEFTCGLVVSQIPPPMRGEDLVALVKELNFDPADLAKMETAINEYCERIDWNSYGVVFCA